MNTHRASLLISAVCLSVACAGCAAVILKSAPDEPQAIQGGSTEADITQRFGLPIKLTRLQLPTQAQSLRHNDRPIVVLNPDGLAVLNSVFAFKGRLDSKARAGQAGFDSFMTLGLSELYLMPKALWERTFDEDLQLTVWFSAAGEALAYRWDQRSVN